MKSMESTSLQDKQFLHHTRLNRPLSYSLEQSLLIEKKDKSQDQVRDQLETYKKN